MYVIGLRGEHGFSFGVKGPKKIGYTSDIKSRLRWLQNGNHCELTIEYLAEMKSKRDAQVFERRLHEAFAERRIQGEWFDLDDYHPTVETVGDSCSQNFSDSPADLMPILESIRGKGSCSDTGGASVP